MSSCASINSVDSLEELYGTNTATVSDIIESPIEEVRRFFLGKSHTQILQYGLGMEIPGAPPLAAHTIVVTMDCEKHEVVPQQNMGSIRFRGKKWRHF